MAQINMASVYNASANHVNLRKLNRFMRSSMEPKKHKGKMYLWFQGNPIYTVLRSGPLGMVRKADYAKGERNIILMEEHRRMLYVCVLIPSRESRMIRADIRSQSPLK